MVEPGRIRCALVVVLVALGGCFEEGETGPDGSVTPPLSDGSNSQPDGGSSNQDSTTSGQPCLSDSDCASLGSSLCGPFVLCKSFVCTHDPTTTVDCTSNDPCLSGSCNPASGACEYTDICECQMADAPLKCGDKIQWAASDAQPPITEVEGVACGQTYGPGLKRAWKFTAQSSQPVVVKSTGGAIASVSALVSPLGGCEPSACMALNEKAVSFVPSVGAMYAIVVEHLNPIVPDSFELQVTCGAAPSETVCDDGIDEDFDNWADCLDSDCVGLAGCPDAQETDCSNGEDDDLNGLVDCQDPMCTFETACLQTCQQQMEISCGFSQGLSTGGGKANATDYTCGPAAPGKEVVYGLTVDQPKMVSVKSGAFIGGVYVMEAPAGTDTCSPKFCSIYGPTEAFFIAEPFKQYYVAIDGPAGDPVEFNIEVECFDFQ